MAISLDDIVATFSPEKRADIERGARVLLDEYPLRQQVDAARQVVAERSADVAVAERLYGALFWELKRRGIVLTLQAVDGDGRAVTLVSPLGDEAEIEVPSAALVPETAF